MKKVTFVNSRGESLTIYKKPYFLSSIEGTGMVSNQIHTYKSPQQDGETYIGNIMGSRQITIEGVIRELDKSRLIELRQNMLRILNPKLDLCKLIYEYDGGTKTINCIVDGSPTFPTSKSIYQQFLIHLYCPDPYWRDINPIKAEIAIWRGALEFPFIIAEEGIELGYREPSLIVNIFNKGDVPCGMRIQFKALATVVNPSLFNVNTREYFKIKRTMEAGEIITVTTHFGNKRVELNKNGVVSNAFIWVDVNSTFLQLEPGDNLFRYDAEEGLDNLEVAIYFTPQYLGV